MGRGRCGIRTSCPSGEATPRPAPAHASTPAALASPLVDPYQPLPQSPLHCIGQPVIGEILLLGQLWAQKRTRPGDAAGDPGPRQPGDDGPLPPPRCGEGAGDGGGVVREANCTHSLQYLSRFPLYQRCAGALLPGSSAGRAVPAGGSPPVSPPPRRTAPPGERNPLSPAVSPGPICP